MAVEIFTLRSVEVLEGDEWSYMALRNLSEDRVITVEPFERKRYESSETWSPWHWERGLRYWYWQEPKD